MNFNLEEIILRIPAILLALTVHECAHGWVAYKMGDRTAHDQGRITLNPAAHLDLLGTIMLFFGPFGWAKPVPVDHRYFENPKKGLLWVSAAGPLSNVILALVFGYLFRIYMSITPGDMLNAHVITFFQLSIMMNAGISFFNLLPVPPLDGSNILLGILPNHMIPRYLQISRYIPPVFMGMLLIEWAAHIPVFTKLINPLFMPYLTIIQFLIFWKI